MNIIKHDACAFSVTVEACVVMKSFLNFFIFASNKLLQLKTLEIEKRLTF